LQAVRKLFELGCPLVILACNTASAKALRSIQQRDLPHINPENRVLGVIRPSVEALWEYTKTKQIGILGTKGTVASMSYPLEIKKFFPEIQVFQEACPMWVPLVENDEYENDGADYFVQKNIANLLNMSKDIDTIILGCTHYPLLLEKIKKYIPTNIQVISQGAIVAESLIDYLKRHPDMDTKLSRHKTRRFLTTDSVSLFEKQAGKFLGSNQPLNAERIYF